MGSPVWYVGHPYSKDIWLTSGVWFCRAVPLCLSFFNILDRSLTILQHYHPYWLYFVAFVVIIGGLITYFWYSTRKLHVFSFAAPIFKTYLAAEEQGQLDPAAPEYVSRRRGGPQPGLDGGVETIPTLPREGVTAV